MKRPTKIHICHRKAPIFLTPVALSFSLQALDYTAGMIRRHSEQSATTTGRRGLFGIMNLLYDCRAYRLEGGSPIDQICPEKVFHATGWGLN
jgi:hypothetical protein